MPAVTTHNFDDIDPLVGCCCIPDLIDHFDDCINCGVKPDGKISAGYIIIDGGRNTDHINASILKAEGTPEGTIPSDHHQAFNSSPAQVLHGFSLAFRGSKCFGAGTLQNGAPPVNNPSYGSPVEGLKLSVHKPLKAPHNP